MLIGEIEKADKERKKKVVKGDAKELKNLLTLPRDGTRLDEEVQTINASVNI